MDINFTWGFYTSAGLCQFSIDLNTSLEYYKELKNLLKVRRNIDNRVIRLGSMSDGGYIMLNSFEKKNGIAYSFGISNDVSWDDAIANKGYDVWQYDHTIERLPYKRNEFHYFKEGISGQDEMDRPLKTLEYFLKKNGHINKRNLILKMDVEGAEWDFLETVTPSVLKQFDQIVFEMHNIVRTVDSHRILQLLKKLNETHSLIHIHGNNTGYQLKIGDTIFPDVIETTYVNKENYDLIDDENMSFPTGIDASCDRNRKDVDLGFWNRPLSL